MLQKVPAQLENRKWWFVWKNYLNKMQRDFIANGLFSVLKNVKVISWSNGSALEAEKTNKKPMFQEEYETLSQISRIEITFKFILKKF